MPKGYLTTHVLDTATGLPAAGMPVALFRITEDGPSKIISLITNDDGRTEAPILPADEFESGVYELVFGVGDYLRGSGQTLPEPLFLDIVPIRFGISDLDAHYHVPLLVSPFGYSTYRGS